MMKRLAPKKIIRIINELYDEGAVTTVYWDSKTRMPRVCLKRWCWPYYGSVSIATASRVLDGIKLGLYVKPTEAHSIRPSAPLIESVFVD